MGRKLAVVKNSVISSQINLFLNCTCTQESLNLTNTWSLCNQLSNSPSNFLSTGYCTERYIQNKQSLWSIYSGWFKNIHALHFVHMFCVHLHVRMYLHEIFHTMIMWLQWSLNDTPTGTNVKRNANTLALHIWLQGVFNTSNKIIYTDDPLAVAK